MDSTERKRKHREIIGKWYRWVLRASRWAWAWGWGSQTLSPTWSRPWASHLVHLRSRQPALREREREREVFRFCMCVFRDGWSHLDWVIYKYKYNPVSCQRACWPSLKQTDAKISRVSVDKVRCMVIPFLFFVHTSLSIQCIYRFHYIISYHVMLEERNHFPPT